jgi:hypothetical protein
MIFDFEGCFYFISFLPIIIYQTAKPILMETRDILFISPLSFFNLLLIPLETRRRIAVWEEQTIGVTCYRPESIGWRIVLHVYVYVKLVIDKI